MPRFDTRRTWRLGLASLLAACSVALVPLASQSQDMAAESDPSQAAGGAASRVPSATAQFTTGVENREPIDQITFVENNIERVFFFSDLRGLEGRTVTHRWTYKGETQAEVEFEVRGPRWRVWSSKTLLPDWVGDWTVEIVTDSGEVIAMETFTYSTPDA